jgi:hypothetical protein
MLGRPDDKFLTMGLVMHAETSHNAGPTVAFDHEWLDDIVSNEFKVRVANPMADSCLGASEEIVKNSDLMPQ